MSSAIDGEEPAGDKVVDSARGLDDHPGHVDAGTDADRRVRTQDRVSGAVLVLVGVFVVQQGLAIGLGRLAEPGGGLMPMVVGVGLVVVGVAVAAGAPAAGTPAVRIPRERRAAMARVTIATAAYFAAVAWLGFLASTVLFLAYLLRTWGRYAWWLVVLLTVVLAGGLYAVFDLWLRNPLPAGIWRDLR